MNDKRVLMWDWAQTPHPAHPFVLLHPPPPSRSNLSRLLLSRLVLRELRNSATRGCHDLDKRLSSKNWVVEKTAGANAESFIMTQVDLSDPEGVMRCELDKKTQATRK